MRFAKAFSPVPMACVSVCTLLNITGTNAAVQAKTGSALHIEEVEVVGHPLSAEGLAQASAVLSGEQLSRSLQASIGATVANIPGVHSASFGQAVGRPVLHGLGGARVRVMEDRIDTLDVSVTSADHATAIEPFIADRVEILKGASTLLYGSGAIGGVVDVHTGRIPHELPEKTLTGRAEARADDSAETRVGALRLDGGAGSFAWHLDGFWRDADNYEIPNFVESAQLRALEEAEGEEHEEEEARGELPGSELEVNGGAFGLSYIGERGFVGFSVSQLDAEYGLPGAHGHGHEHEEEEPGMEEHEEEEGNPTLDMEQTRIDLEAGVENPFAGFSSLNVRVGINDYEHAEIEPSGEVGTLFENEAWEARVELMHKSVGGWEGAVGLQYSDREFSALGEEAFLSPVDTESIGLFWVGERDIADWHIETGLRVETVEHRPSDSGLADTDFTNVSGSLGAIIPLTSDWTLSLQSDYSSRAPVSEELYSNGAHLAAGTFEIGDASLDEETAFNLSATLRYAGSNWYLAGTLYRTDFSDFIYRFNTGLEEDELPVLRYTQEDAVFTGFEAEAKAIVHQWGDGQLSVKAMFDTVTAELDISGNDNLPRIPPTRYGLGLAANWGVVNASLDYTRVDEQDDVAELELPTDAYDDVRAYVGAQFPLEQTTLTVFLQGRNLTDEEQRNHVSFIKDFAPAPGRTLEAGLRFTF
ncbi:TonB-dependent receptor [Exilibacterium tricleocarpae]|uniref:TonB-dependent receptor n=1 Tax=Exilibacterium tricleocarpae TaxID=2591008 RepID=A0A545TNF9_9GAMM|nr:TonB-dependent receptor [Exilibacterium tricleocarpae]TQV78759.1 TonB-dependent receptor [Exilibacterium tricleocarpae]